MLVVTDLFKGATRPACLWGIPYKPAIFTFLFFHAACRLDLDAAYFAERPGFVCHETAD